MSKDAAANLATSADFTFTTLPVTTDQPPTVATPTAPGPNPISSKTTALSVLGADDGGEPNLIYTWSLTGDAARVRFISALNGTNAAKNSVATFSKTGNYSFVVVIHGPIKSNGGEQCECGGESDADDGCRFSDERQRSAEYH